MPRSRSRKVRKGSRNKANFGMKASTEPKYITKRKALSPSYEEAINSVPLPPELGHIVTDYMGTHKRSQPIVLRACDEETKVIADGLVDGNAQRQGEWVIREPKYGNPIGTIMYVNDHLESVDGHPSVIVRTSSGKEVNTWTKNGKEHRNGDQPSSVCTGNNYLKMKWKINGQIHREKGPAVYIKQNNGYVFEYWYLHGKKHRENGPALTVYFPNGNVSSETWYRDNKKYRRNGPAVVEYYLDGTVKSAEWYKYGKLSYFRSYDKNGKLIEEKST